MGTKADKILENALTKLGLQNETSSNQYLKINEIIEELAKINQKNKINPKSTGTISERICEIGLKTSVPNLYKKIGNDWNWMADFSIYGHPFNLLISVKSFKAKERLIVSGSGNNLSPTIGWGLFNDLKEWSYDRVKSYLYRSFIIIYMPTELYKQLPTSVIEIKNINGKPFIRKIDDFVQDMKSALKNGAIDISLI